MTKEESLKLFRYFQQEFAKMDSRFDVAKQDADKILVILDGMKGDIETALTEITANSSQTTRHEKWITKAAKKISLPYRTSP